MGAGFSGRLTTSEKLLQRTSRASERDAEPGPRRSSTTNQPSAAINAGYPELLDSTAALTGRCHGGSLQVLSRMYLRPEPRPARYFPT